MSVTTMSDQASRDAIRSELDTTMLVEAAAGTGKTTSLVTRAIALLRNGRCEIGHLAAITFTVKAAAHLREKMQEKLEEEVRDASGVERERLQAAIAGLGRAFIGTTHAFCAHLLRERPIEAGLDPEFDEIDQVDAVLLMRDFWQRWYDTRAAVGDERITAARAAGLTSDLLRDTFVRLVDYHGDVEIVGEECERPDLEHAVATMRTFLREIEHDLPDGSSEKQDPFEIMIRELLGIERSRDLDDRVAQLAFLSAGAHASKKPTQKNWPDKQRAKNYGLTWSSIATQTVKPAIARWREYVHCVAMNVVRPALADYEAERRRTATVTFNDLLVGARNLLRDHPRVRQYFQRRFTHLLVDEFQDTDPLQAEMLFYLTGEEVSEKDWRKLRPRAGSLFIVGDPKQSIYRFRRADITTYLAVKNRIRESGGAVVALSTNFRSSRAICEFVNSRFERLFDSQSIAEGMQAEHAALEARHEGGTIDGVYLLETQFARNDDVAAAEAECVSRWISRAVASGWTISDEGKERPVRWSDFMLVSRNRPRLWHYAAALERESVPYEVTGAARFAESFHLNAALPLLRAAADPDDAIEVAAFLRGPFCGAADDELYRFAKSNGRWSPFRDLPDDTADSIRDGMAILREAIELSRELPPAAAIARIFERVGIPAVAAADDEPGTAAGNTLLALAIARDESVDGASYPAVVERLSGILESELEIEEMDVDPSRENAVRLMNLHQVKGLEAAVVFLVDPAKPRSYEPDQHVDRTGDVSRGFFPIRKQKGPYGSEDIALPRGWAALAQREQRFTDAEEKRLLYVAATRAKNVLVIGATRNNGALEGRWKDLAAGATEPLFAVSDRTLASDPPAGEMQSFGEAMQLIEKRRVASARQSYSVVPVTRIAHDSHEQLVRAEEGLGRGTSWGRVLHRLFEAMLRDPALDVARYAANLLKDEERDAAELDDVVATVEALRASDLWQRVVRADEKYAEVPFAINVDARSVGVDFDGDTLLHGAIDLVFREGNTWYVVDYKSDATRGRVDALVEHYRAQVEHYARFWSQLTGLETRGGLFFADGAIERWLSSEG